MASARLLIVDDDAQLRSVLAEELEAEAYGVVMHGDQIYFDV